MEPLRGGTLVKTVPPEVQEIWDEAPIKRSPAEWALKYLWDQEEIDVVLSGMSTSEELEENLKLADEGFSNSLILKRRISSKKLRSAYRERETCKLYSVRLLHAMPVRSEYSWELPTVEPCIHVSRR